MSCGVCLVAASGELLSTWTFGFLEYHREQVTPLTPGEPVAHVLSHVHGRHFTTRYIINSCSFIQSGVALALFMNANSAFIIPLT